LTTSDIIAVVARVVSIAVVALVVSLAVVGLVVSVAIVGLVVSVAVLGLGYREAGRRDEEIKRLREEVKRREEERKLQREQFLSDRGERQRRRRAQITAEPPVRAAGSPPGIEGWTLECSAQGWCIRNPSRR
jgi:hypothetical protein